MGSSWQKIELRDKKGRNERVMTVLHDSAVHKCLFFAFRVCHVLLHSLGSFVLQDFGKSISICFPGTKYKPFREHFAYLHYIL